MNLSRLVAGVGVVSIVALLTFTGSSSATATPLRPVVGIGPSFPDYGSIQELMDRRLTISSTQLVALTEDAVSGELVSSGPVQRGAWSSRMSAMAAKDTALYTTRAAYGLEPALAKVTPMVAGGAENLLTGKLGFGFKMPKYAGAGLRAGAGPLTLALVAWELRGMATDGVLGFTGLGDKTGLVCGDQGFGSGGFRNWLTGVDCSLWSANAAWVPNEGASAGLLSTQVCSTSGRCYQLVGVGQAGSHGDWYASFTHTGTYDESNPEAMNMRMADGYISAGVMRSSTWDGGRAATGQLLASTVRAQQPSVVCVSLYNASPGSPDCSIAATPPNVSQSSADPARTRVCDQTGSDGIHYVGTTPVYHDSDVATNGFPSPVCAPLPPGVTSTHLRITEKADGQPDKILTDNQEIDHSAQDAALGANQEVYCSSHACLTDLIDLTSGKTCFSEAATCDGWLDDPNKATKYKCINTGRDAPFADCYAYAHIFNLQKRMEGNPYASPKDGADVGELSGQSLDTAMMGGTPRINFQGRDCFGGGFASPNPLQWVLRPLQCFGEWAFMPRNSAVLSTFEGVQAKWANTGPAKLAGAVQGWHIAPVVTGCSLSMPFPVPMIGRTITVPVIQACPGTPMGDFAPWVRTIVSLALGVTAGFAIKRIVGGWLA